MGDKKQVNVVQEPAENVLNNKNNIKNDKTTNNKNNIKNGTISNGPKSGSNGPKSGNNSGSGGKKPTTSSTTTQANSGSMPAYVKNNIKNDKTTNNKKKS